MKDDQIQAVESVRIAYTPELLATFGLSRREFENFAADWAVPNGLFDNLHGETLRTKLMKHLKMHIMTKIRAIAH